MIESDSEWIECLSEASSIKSGSKLRNLFVTILIFCEPADPVKLWDLFKNDLSDDLYHKARKKNPNIEVEVVYNEALLDIERMLNYQNKSN